MDGFLKSSLIIPSVTVRPSDEFIDYLVAEDMWLPADAYPPVEGGDEEDDGNENVVSDAGVESAIRDALARWGNKITVKCNHVAPSDASWMMPSGSALCTTLGHVYMALKASDRVRSFLQQSRKQDVVLHLQPWISGPPAGEWRCYTRGKRLLFAGQRYPLNSIDIDEDVISEQLSTLWTRHNIGEDVERMVGSFAQVDLWLLNSDSILILGVESPNKETVESIGIFTWEELLNEDVEEGDVIVRALTGQHEMAKPTSNAGIPADMTGEVPGALEELRLVEQAFQRQYEKEK